MSREPACYRRLMRRLVVLLSAIVAVILNAFFNGIGTRAAAEADAVAAASSAHHA